MAVGRSNFQCVQHAGTDSEDGTAKPHEGCIPPNYSDGTTDDDGGYGYADQISNGADARFFGCGALDGLEIKGKVEDVSVVVRSCSQRTKEKSHVYNAIDSSAENVQLTQMVLCLNTLTGIVARSPCQNWIPMNTAMISPKPNRVPQTFELPHGYVKPPHCKASRRLTIAQIRNTAPAKSMFFNRSLTGMWLYFLSGFEKKKNTTNSEMPPNGKLIQKHQRQLSRSVKAPPRIGPTTLAIPNMEDSAAI